MKINFKLVNLDMLDEINISQCPSLFKAQAEGIVKLVAELEPFNYSKISQFDKHLIYEYWRRYDGLDRAFVEGLGAFGEWFVKSATNPELIRRARQWLVEHNYLVPTQSIEARAQEAGENWRKTIKVKEI